MRSPWRSCARATPTSPSAIGAARGPPSSDSWTSSRGAGLPPLRGRSSLSSTMETPEMKRIRYKRLPWALALACAPLVSLAQAEESEPEASVAEPEEGVVHRVVERSEEHTSELQSRANPV